MCTSILAKLFFRIFFLFIVILHVIYKENILKNYVYYQWFIMDHLNTVYLQWLFQQLLDYFDPLVH